MGQSFRAWGKPNPYKRAWVPKVKGGGAPGPVIPSARVAARPLPARAAAPYRTLRSLAGPGRGPAAAGGPGREKLRTRPDRDLQKLHHIGRDRAEGDQRELVRPRFPEGARHLGRAGAADLALGQRVQIDRAELAQHLVGPRTPDGEDGARVGDVGDEVMRPGERRLKRRDGGLRLAVGHEDEKLVGRHPGG